MVSLTHCAPVASALCFISSSADGRARFPKNPSTLAEAAKVELDTP